MKEFRKIWNEETNGFLISNKHLVGIDYDELLRLFLERFSDSRMTETAIRNQCSILKICKKPSCSHSTRHRPLYSEQIKKGYVRIKVAEPNIWMQKNKWVYMETHPYEDFSERSNYVFLDGDKRNFSPDNIERVPLKVMGVFNRLGGCEKGKPDITRLRIAQAKLKIAILDKGEKMGLVVTIKTSKKHCCRLFIEERNRKAREYNSTEERRKKRCEQISRYLERIKVENPEKYKMIKQKHKEYMREYYRRRKNG